MAACTLAIDIDVKQAHAEYAELRRLSDSRDRIRARVQSLLDANVYPFELVLLPVQSRIDATQMRAQLSAAYWDLIEQEAA